VWAYQYDVPAIWRGGRDQSVAIAIVAHPVTGRHFSWPT
jgi:hypothetical protein